MNKEISIIILLIILLMSLTVAQYQPSPQPTPTPQPAVGLQQQQSLQQSLIQQSLQQQSQLVQQQVLLAQQQDPSITPLTDSQIGQVSGADQSLSAPLDHEDQIEGSPARLSDPQLTLQFMETSYYLKDVAFLTKDLGWAVGEPHWSQSEKWFFGTIIKTTDGGLSWTAQDAGVAETFNAVFFIDPDLGWVAGTNGTILHTSDGGAHWTLQKVNTSDEFRGLAFSDTQNGWAAAVRPIHQDWLGEDDDWTASIWHTSNGGRNWTRQTLPENVSLLGRIDFVDSATGWAVGSKRLEEEDIRIRHAGVVYSTTDGGMTWKEQYSPGVDITLTAVDFVDVSTGWAAGFPTSSSLDGGFVFHTSDGGMTWERQEPGGFFDNLWDIQFIDEERGYTVGFNYIAAWGPPVYRTQDGGATWTKIRMDEANPLSVLMPEGFFALALVEDQAVLVGDHDLVGRSSRAWDACPEVVAPGETCYNCDCLFEQSYINRHYLLHDIFFVDNESGWAAGSVSSVPNLWGQVILHTSDGGKTWQVQYENQPPSDDLFSYHRLCSIYFVDRQNGWAVGTSETRWDQSLPPAGNWQHEGAILHTTDGGKTWKDQSGDLYDQWDLEFFAVKFLDEKDGWALATKRFPSQNIFLSHTTDGGEHWSWVDTGIPGTMAVGYALVQGDLEVVDRNNIWAAGGLGEVVHSQDGGVTWRKQNLSCGYPSCPIRCFALAFHDNRSGWLAGEMLFSTTNGGDNWDPANMDERGEGDIQDMQFLDYKNGWMVGVDGLVKKTSDGGQSWRDVEIGIPLDLRGLFLLDEDEGWFVGDYGIIIKAESRSRV
jgi:photosystem II stability/assembly factor-like uncharacterized protein